jgi:hypothetical protein
MLNITYSTTLRNFSTKEFVFWPTQKWQILINLKKFELCTVHSLRSRNLSFLHSPKYEIFRVDFLRAARSHYCPHLRIFFQNFFDTLKYQFLLNSKSGLHGTRPVYRRTPLETLYYIPDKLILDNSDRVNRIAIRRTRYCKLKIELHAETYLHSSLKIISILHI